MSRFVSAGTGEDVDTSGDAWTKAREAVEATRKPAQEKGKQDDGKSLYDVLQRNKEAKQEAFEESIRLKNQFRPLDDDEVEYLDSVQEAERAKEAAVKQETAEQLELFRKQREAAEQASLEGLAGKELGLETTKSGDTWTTKRKRRRDRETETNVGGKVRRVSSGEHSMPIDKSPGSVSTASERIVDSERIKTKSEDADSKTSSSTEPVKVTPGKTVTASLGLGEYSSDED